MTLKDTEALGLLPCPMCGYKVDLVEGSYRNNRWMIYCEGCGLNIRNKPSKEYAIEKWNTRSASNARALLDEARASLNQALLDARNNDRLLRDTIAQKNATISSLGSELQHLRSSLPQGVQPAQAVCDRDETAWLVEKGGDGPPQYITANEFSLTWTTDINEALRLSRRKDAEAISELCDDAWHVVEHVWQVPSGKYLNRVDAIKSTSATLTKDEIGSEQVQNSFSVEPIADTVVLSRSDANSIRSSLQRAWQETRDAETLDLVSTSIATINSIIGVQ